MELQLCASRLNDAIRKGPVDLELKSLVIEITAFLRNTEAPSARPEFLSFVRCCSMAAEISDHFGMVEPAIRLVERAPSWLGVLPGDLRILSEPLEIELARELLRCNLVLTLLTAYRQGQGDEAVRRLYQLLEQVRSLPTDSSKPHRIEAQLFRYLGEAERRAGNHQKASEWFNQSVQTLLTRVQSSNVDDRPDESTYASHRMALALLGQARVAYAMGLVTSGQGFVSATKGLLIQWNDPLTAATADMLSGALFRNRASDKGDKGNLEPAARLLEGALETFRRFDHQPKLLRANYELALLHIVRGDSKKAHDRLEAVGRSAALLRKSGAISSRRADRFTTYALTRRSRVYRELDADLDNALAVSMDAVIAAETLQLERPLMDALVERASVLLEQPSGSLEIAIADLTRCLEINSANGHEPAVPRYFVIANARLAQCYMRQGMLMDAANHLRVAETASGGMEYANVVKLVQRVKSELEQKKRGFVVEMDGTLNYSNLERELRLFLLRAAGFRAKRKEDVADLLDIAPSTLYKWQSELGLTSPPADGVTRRGRPRKNVRKR